MRKRIFFCLFVLFGLSNLQARDFTIKSPGGKLVLTVSVGDFIGYRVFYEGNFIAGGHHLALETLKHGILGSEPVVRKNKTINHDEMLSPVVAVKNASVPDRYNELQLFFRGAFGLKFRIYDDGVAYRFETSFSDSLEIKNEKLLLAFPEGTEAFYPREESMFSHNEREYIHLGISDIMPGDMASLPVLFHGGNGMSILITESGLKDYPGMWMEGTGANEMRALFPAWPVEVEQTSDRDVAPTRRADFIAHTAGMRSFPWRLMIIVPEDKDLLASQMVYKLAPEQELDNTGWIRPGKVAWDWWNALNVYHVGFRSGVNTNTYKYFIDFASAHGIEYIILDEGWYKLGNLLDVNPDVNLEEIIDYGKKKNVGVILWVVWKTLDDQLEEAMNWFEELGVAGIKVDFMQRDDQWMVNYYWKIAREAAKRHLLVDFHGAYKPSGLSRAWPNVITREGVRGLEWNKWSDYITPKHDVTLPFIRMVAGPMDYTPGAMRNAHKENFHASFSRPMSQGTRVHQMAMYVVYESPLQMLADNPSNYLREPDCLEFIAGVPVTWDETLPLAGKVGEFVAVARRNGDTWYLGAMSGDSAKTFSLDLSFLPSGTYELRYFRDGKNADRFAEDFNTGTVLLDPGQNLNIKMAPGGGWVGVLNKKSE